MGLRTSFPWRKSRAARQKRGTAGQPRCAPHACASVGMLAPKVSPLCLCNDHTSRASVNTGVRTRCPAAGGGVGHRGHAATWLLCYAPGACHAVQRAAALWGCHPRLPLLPLQVCMQGGIHPDFTGDTYLQILRAAKAGAPDMHVHAFSPLEVFEVRRVRVWMRVASVQPTCSVLRCMACRRQAPHFSSPLPLSPTPPKQGARSLGVSVASFLATLKDAGLGSLPGTAAEVLHDGVRGVLCPDKLNTQEWLEVGAFNALHQTNALHWCRWRRLLLVYMGVRVHMEGQHGALARHPHTVAGGCTELIA